MISESAALERILAAMGPMKAETMALFEALDRCAAEDVTAKVPIPAFDMSSMDGYALLAAESTGPKALRVLGEQPAGLDRGLRLESGCAIRIFTGASIPAGADAVIMQEDVRREGDEIFCEEPVVVGENIRRAAQRRKNHSRAAGGASFARSGKNHGACAATRGGPEHGG
jgi:molybdopterin molybdotransferase